ncbi:hypothetical protein EDC15_103158 [Acetobacter aceti NBRC 14818]|uniref:Uncharacterized protein n=2 Tax=Acetobacter aceti TaxID=435 RepID=A0A6S6PEA7_ACEAC|nr:hypothetical protein [Acetobacter aceti]TCS34554.1 hypothetical protein EDC15_103158 [Acetobacter aceti NBRC 14818]BCI66048.1 hypothetical protein AAJCM20276_06720 [Acetobacter aceti]BCK76979.1 hypothetical protein EMQ_2585 [Acetobacter aceti NBRC 14818]GAN56420.1 hypothetical protein Abac_006_148 [Acetobacter aceti NBRC 14818]
MAHERILKNSFFTVLLSGLVLISGMVFQSDVADAQSRYNGRASSTASRTEGYRQSGTSRSMPRSGTALTTTSRLPEKRAQSARPERIGGPYRSVLTPRAAPEAPVFPHTAKAVVPQSYKSEYIPASSAKR